MIVIKYIHHIENFIRTRTNNTIIYIIDYANYRYKGNDSFLISFANTNLNSLFFIVTKNYKLSSDLTNLQNIFELSTNSAVQMKNDIDDVCLLSLYFFIICLGFKNVIIVSDDNYAFMTFPMKKLSIKAFIDRNYPEEMLCRTYSPFIDSIIRNCFSPTQYGNYLSTPPYVNNAYQIDVLANFRETLLLNFITE
jgi:hypothetical protein